MTELIVMLLEKPHVRTSKLISWYHSTMKSALPLNLANISREKKTTNILLALLFIITQVLTNLNTKGVLDAKFSFITAFGNGFFLSIENCK